MRIFIVLVLLTIASSLKSQVQEWKQIIYSNPEATFIELCEQIDHFFEKKEANNSDVIKSNDEENKEGSAYNQYQQWRYFMQFRLTEDGRIPSADIILDVFSNEKAKQKVTKSADCDWTFIDQVDNDGGYWGIGRTTCVTFHPTNDQLFYVCTPGGGIWKTTDGGQNYNSSDDGLPYGASSNLLIDPNNPSILYVSNGDHVGWWTGSTGVYKSTDAGLTWLPTALDFNLNSTAIYELKMSPSDPNMLLAATTNGLYQTLDGGLIWTKIRNNSHGSVCFEPGNGQTIYTATDDYWGVSQVYKSIDGGQNWIQATNFTDNHNFIRLANTPLDVNRLLVSCSFDGNKPLYESTDAGLSFNQHTDTPENAIIGYSANDVNTIYSGYVVAYRSTDGGQNWNQITDWWGSGSYPEIHADFHYIAYSNNASHIYFCNDGGVYKLNETTDSWADLSNGLKIGQFYRIANAGNHDVFMIGGTQDNGGRKRLTNGSWVNVNGGDGMEVAIQPDDINTYYTTYINGTALSRTTNGGSNTVDIHDNIPGVTYGQWVTPYDLDPNNSNVIIAAYDNIFRTEDQGDTWTQIATNTIAVEEGFTDLEIAPSNSQIIYAAFRNYLFKTVDGGLNWTNDNLSASAPITRIAVHPTNPDKIWVTRGDYTNNYKVFYSSNGGLNWTNYSTGLPNVPCNVIIYEPNSPGRLYVGNDYGVYYRDSLMTSWEVYGNNLPVTFVNDLKIVTSSQKLRAGTFGRGIWEVDLCATSTAGLIESSISDQYALIYPNPSKNVFSIVQKTIFPVEQIILYDLQGKKVNFQSSKNGSVTEISFDLSPGIYLLNYVVNGTGYSTKVTVE